MNVYRDNPDITLFLAGKIQYCYSTEQLMQFLINKNDCVTRFEFKCSGTELTIMVALWGGGQAKLCGEVGTPMPKHNI